MSDMLETFVRKEITNEIKTNYRISSIQPECMQELCRQNRMAKNICTLSRFLTKQLNVDNDFPEIPNVRSSIQIQKDDIVVVLLLYGGSDVFILGRCER